MFRRAVVASFFIFSMLPFTTKADEFVGLEQRADEFMQACEAASPEEREFVNCDCGKAYVLDFPAQLEAAKKKKHDEYLARAEHFKPDIVSRYGEDVMAKIEEYCPLRSRSRENEELSADDRAKLEEMEKILSGRKGSDANIYCNTLDRAELELTREMTKLPAFKFFWRNATRHKACRNLGEMKSVLQKDLPAKPAGSSFKSMSFPLKFTKLMTSLNGKRTVELSYSVETDLDSETVEKLRKDAFKIGAERAVRSYFRDDWENKTVMGSMELEMQAEINKALRELAPGHYVYDLKITDVRWSD